MRWGPKQRVEDNMEDMVQLKRLRPLIEVIGPTMGMMPVANSCAVLIEHLEYFKQFQKLFGRQIGEMCQYRRVRRGRRC